jgi:hypothetical protein
MPAQAGIQLWAVELVQKLDPSLRWGDGWGSIGSQVGCHRNPRQVITSNEFIRCGYIMIDDLIDQCCLPTSAQLYLVVFV